MQIDASAVLAWDSKVAPVARGESAVLKLVLHRLPEPDEATRWDEILAFRADPDARASLAALRVWMRRTAGGFTTELALAEELEHLVSEYESHMRLHRIKHQRGFLELLVTTTAQLLEDAVKLRLSNVAAKLFSLDKTEIALLEAERAAPGREVAYISRAHDSFGLRR
jgi:hypothetical protein